MRAFVSYKKSHQKSSDTPTKKTETPLYVIVTTRVPSLSPALLQTSSPPKQSINTTHFPSSYILTTPTLSKMAEPQPSTIHEGSSTPSSLPAPNKPEAQALNSLDGPPSSANETSKPSNGDAKALNHAMKNLDVGGKKAEVKNVKVEVGDIGLLVSLLLGGVGGSACGTEADAFDC